MAVSAAFVRKPFEGNVLASLLQIGAVCRL